MIDTLLLTALKESIKSFSDALQNERPNLSLELSNSRVEDENGIIYVGFMLEVK